MKNLIQLLIISFLVTNVTAAQQKKFVLINKINQDSIFIKENHRIKLFTIDGKKVSGRLKIIDNNTILVKNDTIVINSIVQIKKASTFSTIIGPIFAVPGATLIGGGLIALNDKGSSGFISPQAIGAAALIIGTPMFVIPIAAAKHPRSRYEYKIIQNNNPNK